MPLDGSSPVEAPAIPPPAAGAPFPGHHREDDKHPAHPDLIMAPELFADRPVGGLLMGPTGVLLQSLRGQVGPEPRPAPTASTDTHTAATSLHADLSRRTFGGWPAQAPTWLRARAAT